MSARVTGVLRRRDVEGGVWELRAPDAVYTLYGDVPVGLAGQKVEVEGDSEEVFGIGMAGPAITVRKIRRA